MRGMMGSFLGDGAGAIPLTSVGIIVHQATLGEDDMDARDLFLDQHAAMHSVTVGGNTMSAAERTFTGLTDEQMRVRPREDLNSLAWLMWHIARAEDIFVNALLAGGPQVLDSAWKKRLGVDRDDFGIGMATAEVTALTGQVDPGALRAYRDAVGLRTRELVSAFKPQDWQGAVAAEAVERAAAAGAFGARTAQFSKALPGRPRATMLSGIALIHSAGHMGEAATIRTAGGFGTGV
jgi:DinB superfamily